MPTIKNLDVTFAISGDIILTVAIDKSKKRETLQIADEVLTIIANGKTADVAFKEHKEQRSLDANAYCWVLINKLSKKVGVPPADIYREQIKNVGGNHEILCVRETAAEKFKKVWESRGIGWIAEQDTSKVKGCVNLWLYMGSSVYDTAQMQRLIDLIVEECKLQGIETRTPEELAKLVEDWK